MKLKLFRRRSDAKLWREIAMLANSSHPEGSDLPPPFGHCPTCGTTRPVEAEGTCSGCGATVYFQRDDQWIPVM